MSSRRMTTPKGPERFNLRLEAPLKARLTEAATKAGFATVSAYERHILMREMGRKELQLSNRSEFARG